MIAAQREETIGSAAPLRLQASIAVDQYVDDGVLAYRMLCGFDPHEAVIDDDNSFDRHVLASILAVAATQPGGIGAGAGLAAPDLAALIVQWFPFAAVAVVDRCQSAVAAEDDEVVMVRDMLLTQRSTDGDVGRWLAAMVARRAVEPNHLWEDLGLRDRSELSRLLMRHFAPLAVRNTGNMRWKRFFYRMLCEQDGFVMCSTPVCTDCSDFNVCFGDESGESRMADRRRQVSLQQLSIQAAPAGVRAQTFAAE
jgi:nitrogen fixation protein NifQ